jgi:hypothetical protein
MDFVRVERVAKGTARGSMYLDQRLKVLLIVGALGFA